MECLLRYLNLLHQQLKIYHRHHPRVQAILLKMGEQRLLVINVHFPTDSKVEDFDTDEILTTIESMNRVIDKSDCTDTIITGDINCDFVRRTKFVEIVQNFINETGLIKS